MSQQTKRPWIVMWLATTVLVLATAGGCSRRPTEEQAGQGDSEPSLQLAETSQSGEAPGAVARRADDPRSPHGPAKVRTITDDTYVHVATWPTGKTRFRRGSFACDGQRLAYGTADGGSHVLELATGEIQPAEPPAGGGPSSSDKETATADGRFKARIVQNDRHVEVVGDDGATLLSLKPFESGVNRVTAIAQDPSGRYLLLGGSNGAIQIIEVAAGKMVWQFGGQSEDTSETVFVGFSPPMDRVIGAFADGTVRTWDADPPRGQPDHLLEQAMRGAGAAGQAAEEDFPQCFCVGYGAKIGPFAFTHDGTRIAWCSAGSGSVSVWDTATGVEQLALQAHEKAIGSLAFSPDDAILATGGTDGVVSLWDARSGKKLNDLFGHNGIVSEVRFLLDGTRLLSVGAIPRNLVLWDVQTGRKMSECPREPLAFAVSRDETRLLAGQADASLYDTRSGQELMKFPGHLADTNAPIPMAANGFSFSPDGERAASWFSSMALWDCTTGKRLWFHRRPVAGQEAIEACFTPDGKQIFRRERQTHRILDAFTGTEQYAIHQRFGPATRAQCLQPSSASCNRTFLLGERGEIYAAFIDRTAAGSTNVQLLKWNGTKLDAVLEFDTGKERVVELILSDDASRLAAVVTADEKAKRVAVYEVSSGKVISRLTPNSDLLYRIAFSPVASQILTYDTAGRLYVWGPQAGGFQQSRQLTLSDERGKVPLRPDAAQRLALKVRGADGPVLTPSGAEAYVITEPHFTVVDTKIEKTLARLAFAGDRRVVVRNDGRRALSLGPGARLWHAVSCNKLAELRGHEGPALAGLWTADERIVVTSGADGTIRCWDPRSTRVLSTWRGHTGAVPSVALSTDGRLLVSGGEDRTIILWAFATGQPLVRFGASVDPIRWLELSDDGKVLFALTATGQCTSWNLDFFLHDTVLPAIDNTQVAQPRASVSAAAGVQKEHRSRAWWFDRARAEISRIADKESLPWVHRDLALALAAVGDLAGSKAALAQMETLNRDEARYAAVLALLARARQGDVAAACAEAETLREPSRRLSAYCGLAKICSEAGQDAQANQMLELARVALEEMNPHSRYSEEQTYKSVQEPLDAKRKRAEAQCAVPLDKLLETAENDERPVEKGKAHLEVARAQLRLGDRAAARNSLQHATNALMERKNYLPPSIWTDIAQLQLEAGNPPEASKALETGGHPEGRADIWMRIARAQFRDEDAAAAKKSLRAACDAALSIRLSSQAVEKCMLVSQTQAECDDGAGARETLRRTHQRIASEDRAANVLFRDVAGARAKVGDMDGAQKSLQAITDPLEKAQGCANVGKALTGRGEIAGAVELLSENPDPLTAAYIAMGAGEGMKDAGPAAPAGLPVAAIAPGVAATPTRTVDCGGVKMELVEIPQGRFLRGNTIVHFAKPFWMGKCEVTQGQWLAVMGRNPSEYDTEADLPVESVTWDDCQVFCAKLSGRIGKRVRLPSEAEWEYACRAGSQTDYPFGDPAKADEYAWFKDNSKARTHPVGTKKPNAWGLYDMPGNVCEWIDDSSGGNWAYPLEAAVDPRSSDGGGILVRGGSWKLPIECLRSDHRMGLMVPRDDIGFRVIIDIPADGSDPPGAVVVPVSPGQPMAKSSEAGAQPSAPAQEDGLDKMPATGTAAVTRAPVSPQPVARRPEWAKIEESLANPNLAIVEQIKRAMELAEQGDTDPRVMRYIAHNLQYTDDGGLAGVRALVNWGEPAVELLAQESSVNTELKSYICWGLGELGGPLAAKTLGKIAQDGADNHRPAAFEALLRIGTPATEELLSILRGAHGREAVRFLARLGGPTAVDALIAALDHPDRLTRIEAARGLGLLRDTRALVRFKEILADFGPAADADALCQMIGAAMKEIQAGPNPDLGLSAASPVLAEAVMFRGNPQRTGCYATRGVHESPRIRWQFRTNPPDKIFNYVAPPGADLSPVITQGVVAIYSCERGADGYFACYGIDAASGQQLWIHHLPGITQQGPMPAAASRGVFYLGTGGGELHAVDAKTHALRWKFGPSGTVTAPAVAFGRLLFGCADCNVYGLSLDTGEISWICNTGKDPKTQPRVIPSGSGRIDPRVQRQRDEAKRQMGGAVQSPIVLDSRQIYFDVADKGPYAVDIRSKSQSWQFWEGGRCRVALIGNLLYLGGGQVLDARSGIRRPFYEIPEFALGNGYAWAQAGKTLCILTGGGRVCGREIATQRDRWAQQFEAGTLASPSVADGVLYFGTTRGVLHALDVQTGVRKWSLALGGAINIAPVIHQGVVYVTNTDGTLFAVDGGSREVPGEMPVPTP